MTFLNTAKRVNRVQEVGKINAKVISLLNLNIADGTPIYLGESNIQHMKKRHPADFEKYSNRISDILAAPDYVRQSPKDGSIEYVKEYQINSEFVKVAVRISGGGKLFARSLYVLNKNRVQNFIEKGTLKSLDK